MSKSGSRLRVLQVVGALYFGGAERIVAELVTNADVSRFETMVCVTRGFGPLAEEVRSAGIPVVLAGGSSAGHPYAAPWHVQRTISKLRADVVHTHDLLGMSQLAPSALARRAPYWIHTFHYGNYPYPKRRYMIGERLYSRLPDRLVAVSEAQRRAILHHHALPSERVLTLPNGVRDHQGTMDPEARARARADLGVPDHVKVVGTVAVLTEQKGIAYLLEAATSVIRVMPDVRFVLVGGGPLETELRSRAQALGLGAAVVFTGWRPDVPQLLRAFDVFVSSSLWEAMPLALLEAMAAGLPIVVTDVSDNRQIVTEGAAGLVAPAGDSAALADALLRMLEAPVLASEMGASARTLFEQKFSITRMVQQYEELYLRARQSSSPHRQRPKAALTRQT